MFTTDFPPFWESYPSLDEYNVYYYSLPDDAPGLVTVAIGRSSYRRMLRGEIQSTAVLPGGQAKLNLSTFLSAQLASVTTRPSGKLSFLYVAWLLVRSSTVV